MPAARTRSCPAPTAPSSSAPTPHSWRSDHGLRTRPPNTLYTGDSPGGTFLYRVYAPDAGRDETGGVPLPRVTLESRDGTGTPLTVEQCRELQAPYAWQLNDLIAGGPGLPDPNDTARASSGATRPTGGCSRTSAARLDIMLDNESGEPFQPGAAERCGDGPGFCSNRDIAYVFVPCRSRPRRRLHDRRLHRGEPSGRGAARVRRHLAAVGPRRPRDC
jgi:hypothetical protein